MAKYLKLPESERRSSRISLDAPNFEYLMIKAAQHNVHSENSTTRYDIIKRAAIYFLGSNILRSVQIIQNGFGFGCCEGLDAGHKLPYKAFNWLDLEPEEFRKRRSENLFWLDIMEKYISDDCLEQKKLYNDVEMLQHYVRKLFRAYIFSQMDIVNEELERMHDYLSKFEEMSEEYDECTNKLNTVTKKLFVSTFTKHLSLDKIFPIRMQIHEYMMESCIENRCVNALCAAKIGEEQYDADHKIHLIQEQIDYYNMKIKNEQIAHINSINVYLTLCDQYRFNLYMMYENYHKKCDFYDNNLTSKLASINMMKDNIRFYEDVIESNHRVIADLERQDEEREEAKRKAEEEQLQMEKLQLAAKKALRKKKKLAKNIKGNLKNPRKIIKN